jgi:ribonuclease P protein component
MVASFWRAGERKGGKDLLLKRTTMLSFKHRLTKGKDFEKIKEKGSFYQGRFFGLVVLRRKDKKPSRFGFIVSTKISKKAVVRNRIKRILREIVRQNLDKVNKGFDVLFLVKKKAVEEKGKDFEKEIISVFRKANLIE